MRRLLPDPCELALEDLYAGLTLPTRDEFGGDASRPWLALDMVATVDGAATIEGRTSRLGGAADHIAFRRLRDACDALLVGAGTVRLENYGPPTGDADRRAGRQARGLAPTPRLVIVTASLDLDPAHRAFADPHHRPIVVVPAAAPADRAERMAAVAEVVCIGEQTVDLPALLDHLGTAGFRRILCEGGPTLNRTLLADDLVDELFLTVSPTLTGGPAPRIIRGDGEQPPRDLTLVSLHEHDGELVLRYRRSNVQEM